MFATAIAASAVFLADSDHESTSVCLSIVLAFSGMFDLNVGTLQSESAAIVGAVRFESIAVVQRFIDDVPVISAVFWFSFMPDDSALDYVAGLCRSSVLRWRALIGEFACVADSLLCGCDDFVLSLFDFQVFGWRQSVTF